MLLSVCDYDGAGHKDVRPGLCDCSGLGCETVLGGGGVSGGVSDAAGDNGLRVRAPVCVRV